MHLTKQQIRAVLDEYPTYHTDACREHNPRKQPGGHPHNCPVPPRATITIFGGYHCICDWRARVEAAFLLMQNGGPAQD